MSKNPLDQYYYDDDRPQHALFANLDSINSHAKSIDKHSDSNSGGSTATDCFPPKVNLARENQPEFWVSMEAFFDLSFWIAEQIEDLVATHKIHHSTATYR